MEHFLSFLVWIRRTLGAAVVTGVVIVMLYLPKPLVLAASAALVDQVPCLSWAELSDGSTPLP